MLDSDSLLNIFYLYRPVILERHEGSIDHWYFNCANEWDRERWWYKVAQVCQRWRDLILGSPSYLGLCLVCKNGTPVAEMLARSPPLPLVFDYQVPDVPDLYLGAEEKDGIILALGHRDRVRRICFQMCVSNLQELIPSIDEEYPVLEYLILDHPLVDSDKSLMLPETLQAPRLRHLQLERIALPMGSRLFPAAVGLVTLALHPSNDFHPNILLHWLSFMPQLEKFTISIPHPVANEDAEMQPMHTPIMTHITLPSLNWFEFYGDSAFLEDFVHRITAPRLAWIRFWFAEEPTFFVPSLLQIMDTTRHNKFDSGRFTINSGQIFVGVYRRGVSALYVISMGVHCSPPDLQVSSVAQIFDSIGPIFSTVEYLAFEYEVPEYFEEQNEFDRTEWRRLLRPFSNVKTLRIDEELVEGVSRCLRLDDGEDPLELLPELQELTYSGSGDTGDAFTSFIDARQNAGSPVTLISKPKSVTTLSRSSSQSSLESSSAITWNSEVVEAGTGAGNDLDT
jgi:hypothetical protein